MKVFRRIRDRGISIRILNIAALCLAVILSVFLFLVVSKTNEYYENSSETTQDMIRARESANDVTKASDYLTEQIRSFAVTGERQYLDDYFNEVNVSMRREKALEALDRISDNTTALNALENAISESKALEKQEYYAARMTIEAFGYSVSDYPEVIREYELTAEDQQLTAENKKKKAVELLFNDKYQEKKEAISSNTKNCLGTLLDELDRLQKDAMEKLRKYVFLEHLLAGILAVTILLVVLVTSILIITPVSKAVALIRDEKDIPVKGAYEMRFLAKTYNLIYNTHVQSKKQLSFEANHDKLTGIYNRRGYDFLLKNTDLETSALMLIDLDKFKEINDRYGHEMGDKVLKKTADAIFSSFRSDDYVCRIGGDEFAVIMLHLGPSLIDLVKMKYEMMSKKLADGSDGIPPITISSGVAFGEYRIGASAWFKNADRALYAAKEAGRNTIRFHKFS